MLIDYIKEVKTMAVVERGRLTYEKDGVNCTYEIRDDFCVSKEKAQELLKEIAECVYPNLLQQYKEKMATEG